MKKWLLATGLTLSSLTLAQLCNAAPYIGVGFGYTNIKISSKTVNGNTVTKDNSSANGFDGLLFAGYRYKFDFDQFNLAAQVNLTGYNANSSSHIVDNATLKESQLYSYGIDLLPGFYIAKNVNLYAIAGYQNGRFKFKRSVNNSTAYSEQQNMGGYDLGLGTDITLENNFALTLHYKYTNYGSDKIHESSSFYDRKRVTSNQFNIGVMYYFA